MAGVRTPLADALLAAPVGVCLIADLEEAGRSVGSMSFGDLATAGVWAGYMSSGPWMPDAPETVARAYLGAPDRTAVADAIADRFGAELEAPADLERQELWFTGPWEDDRPPGPVFGDLDAAYDAGEFPLAGLFTANGPPAEAHNDLAGAWELDFDPLTRWRLPVVGSPRVLDLHRPQDWVGLVERHPKGAGEHGSWSLPGQSHRRGYVDARALEEASGGRACRAEVAAHLVPDWASVAGEWDAIHLSWAGFLTSEALVSDVARGGVAMLRFWLGERVLWLRDCFGEPQPMTGPVMPEQDSNPVRSVDVRADPGRQARDRRWIAGMLGR
jgi:hypothetical protein